MPKDKREAKIYYHSRLREIADIYFFFIIARGLGLIAFAVKFIEQSDLLFCFALVMMVFLLILRMIAYFIRDRNWDLFSNHLVIVNAIEMIAFSFVYYSQLRKL